MAGAVVIAISGCDRAESVAIPDRIFDLGGACEKGSLLGDKRKFFPDAASVQGSTHPVALFESDFHHSVGRGGKYHLTWGDSSAKIENPKTVQLIACAHHESSYDGQTVGTCHFDKPKAVEAPVVRSKIGVLVFELKTGKKYDEFTFDTSNVSCPAFDLVAEGKEGSATVNAAPSAKEYFAAVNQHIPGAAAVTG